MKRVYIAGKLNGDACQYVRNCHDMIVLGNECRRHGFAVFIPCLDLLSGLVDGSMTYADYFDNNLPWLEVSDAMLLVPNWLESKGANAEVQHAKDLGIPVCNSVYEVMQALRD